MEKKENKSLKIFLVILATVVILSAVFLVAKWQQNKANDPIRQNEEIR